MISVESVALVSLSKVAPLVDLGRTALSTERVQTLANDPMPVPRRTDSICDRLGILSNSGLRGVPKTGILDL
jgi:hypothetical protein